MTSFQANLLLPKGEPRSTHMFFTSPNIKDQSYLDIKYTKYGENRMPSFYWDPVDNASYYALFCVDITRPWNHLYIPYISISKSSISLNAENSIVGINSFGNYVSFVPNGLLCLHLEAGDTPIFSTSLPFKQIKIKMKPT